MLNFLLSGVAIAQEGGVESSTSGDSFITNFLPLILIMAVFYFLLLRPQQKRAKQHQNMVSSLAKGTKVITGGGILGVISESKDGESFVTVEIAQGTKIKVKRETVLEVVKSDEKLAESKMPAKTQKTGNFSKKSPKKAEPSKKTAPSAEKNEVDA